MGPLSLLSMRHSLFSPSLQLRTPPQTHTRARFDRTDGAGKVVWEFEIPLYGKEREQVCRAATHTGHDPHNFIRASLTQGDFSNAPQFPGFWSCQTPWIQRLNSFSWIRAHPRIAHSGSLPNRTTLLKKARLSLRRCFTRITFSGAIGLW